MELDGYFKLHKGFAHNPASPTGPGLASTGTSKIFMAYAGEGFDDIYYAWCDTSVSDLQTSWSGNIKIKVNGKTATDIVFSQAMAWHSEKLVIFLGKGDRSSIYCLSFDGTNWEASSILNNLQFGALYPQAAVDVNGHLFLGCWVDGSQFAIFTCTGDPTQSSSWTLTATLQTSKDGFIKFSTDAKRLIGLISDSAGTKYFFLAPGTKNVTDLTKTTQWGKVVADPSSPVMENPPIPVSFNGSLILINSDKHNHLYSAVGTFKKIAGNEQDYLLTIAEPMQFNGNVAKSLDFPAAVMNNDKLCFANVGVTADLIDSAPLWFGWLDR